MADNAINIQEKRVLSLFRAALWLSGILCLALLSLFLERFFPEKGREVYYVFNPQAIKAVSGSFKSFSADIFYIRGILAVTDRFENRREWREKIQGNLDAAVKLDPELLQAYFFGGVVIGQDEEGMREGIGFLEKGMAGHPEEWELPYWIGMNYYQLGEYLKSARYFEKAAFLPGAPGFLKSIQPMAYYRAGSPELGILFLRTLKDSVTDARQLGMIEKKLEWLQRIILIEREVETFSRRFGKRPVSLDELVASGLVDSLPEDPFGKGFYIDSETGRVKSRF